MDEKRSKWAGISTVSDTDDIMLITNLGQLIRISASDIRKCSRSAGGVIVMRLSDGQFITNVTRIENEDNVEDETGKGADGTENAEKVEKNDMPLLPDEAAADTDNSDGNEEI